MNIQIGLEPRAEARPGHRHLAGALALIGGALMITGTFLPWLSVFDGLRTIDGMAGRNGRILAIAGAGAAVAGAFLLVRGGRRLGLAIGVFGALAAAFAAYLVAQLLVTMHGLDGMLLAKVGPGLFVSAGGTLLVAGSLLAPETLQVRLRAPRQAPLRTPMERSRSQALTTIVALASAGAGVIHLTVAPDHLREFLAFGVFLMVAGVAQLVWAGLVWTQPSRRVLVAGAAGNALVVLLWIASRTSGLPIGPEHWTPEAAGFADIVCSAYEVLLVIGAALLLRGPDREVRPLPSLMARFGTVAIGVPLTVAAVLSGAGVLGSGPMHM